MFPKFNKYRRPNKAADEIDPSHIPTDRAVTAALMTNVYISEWI